MTPTYDIAIVGGGVNGCGIARDVAGRGLSVFLCEMGDIGGATSSASTKLIHGGLRYLEHHDFSLVRHALIEREKLWAIAPHIIWPLRFVLPHRKGMRPAWLLRLGLLIYDHLGGRKLLPATRTLRLRKDRAGEPLRDMSALGFEYSDCWVQDNRLVVLNARDAEAKGASINPRTRWLSATRETGLWTVIVEDVETAARRTIRARALVNAAGPWSGGVIAGLGVPAGGKLRLVRGSHIVVPKLYDHDRCYIFQNSDGRIVFAIPYEDEFTLIGTTDVDQDGALEDVSASAAEIEYLCRTASENFRRPVEPGHVVWTYSGVRALYDDGAGDAKSTTRDYHLVLDAPKGGAALLTVYGGKITTYRRLAEDVLKQLSACMPELAMHAGWTAVNALPGGDMPVGGADAYARRLRQDFPFLDERQARRMVQHYGTEARHILGNARSAADLGLDFGGSLSEAEVIHLMDKEYARTAEDVVWRRTKSGLRMSRQQVDALDDWMRNRSAKDEKVERRLAG
jgi:glycerol-3-phosphate dehydrogenase